MAKHKTAWRELTKAEKIKYAVGMRRLNLGTWGYPVSTLRAIHLTTREGNDNTTKVFAYDLRKLVLKFRGQGMICSMMARWNIRLRSICYIGTGYLE